jgi:LysM repeat protein
MLIPNRRSEVRVHRIGILFRSLVAVVALVLFCAASNLRAELVYQVKANDTLTGIARQHGTSVSALAARNNLRPTDRLLVGQRLIIPGSRPETEYVVRSGDSLAAIAQQFGVSVQAIVQHNGIRQPDKIAAGQRLRIPGAATQPATPALPPEVQSKLEAIKVAPKRWQRIVIHHSGTPLDTPKSMDRYHRSERRMENGLAYHFVIGNGVRTKDGEIYVGRRWMDQLDGGHLASSSLNSTSIGICLIGDFNQQPPSEKQLEALHLLTTYLMKRCGVSKSNVRTHRQINTRPTQCPGSKFPTQSFVATLP